MAKEDTEKRHYKLKNTASSLFYQTTNTFTHRSIMSQ